MRPWIHVARWEFVTTVRNPAFIGTLIGLPVFFLAISALIGFSLQMVAHDPRQISPIGIVDSAGLLQSLEECAPSLKTGAQAGPTGDEAHPAGADGPCTLYSSLETCEDALQRRRARACYVIADSFLATGKVTGYRQPPRSLAGLGQPIADAERVARLIRRGLIDSWRGSRATPPYVRADDGSRAAPAVADDPFAARMLDPLAGLTQHVLDAGGQPIDSPMGAALGLVSTLGLGMFLTFGIFFAAGFLQTAAGRERQSRLHETLLATIPARSLVGGKMLGLGAAGLVQTACHFLLIIVPSGLWLPAAGLTPAHITASAFYFLLGYALFAAVLVTAGIVMQGETGAQETATILGLVTAVPMVLIAVIGFAPNGLMSRTLSGFPLTAPVAMLVRLGLAPIAWTDHLIATASIGLSIGGCLWLAAWLLRASALMTGQRISVPALWRTRRQVRRSA